MYQLYSCFLFFCFFFPRATSWVVLYSYVVRAINKPLRTYQLAYTLWIPDLLYLATVSEICSVTKRIDTKLAPSIGTLANSETVKILLLQLVWKSSLLF